MIHPPVLWVNYACRFWRLRYSFTASGSGNSAPGVGVGTNASGVGGGNNASGVGAGTTASGVDRPEPTVQGLVPLG